MIIGVGLDSRLQLGLDDLESLGEEAARLGFESLWTPSGSVPDAFHVCHRWVTASRRVAGASLRTGIGVIPAPRVWHPVSLAAQAATLGEMSGGRFVLGIGTGGAGEAFFAEIGLPNRPVAVMTEYLDVLHRLLAGERVERAGPLLALRDASIGRIGAEVPLYLAALGPQMLRLAGRSADGVGLNWASPSQITWSRGVVAEAAESAGRDASAIGLSMYIRVCVDDDVTEARRALAGQVLGYGLARPGVDPSLGYRGHFGRMGFDAALRTIEARRDAGAKTEELVDEVPEELLAAVGYYGRPEGAAERFAALAAGLDEVIVRVVTARKTKEAVSYAMAALTPEKIRAASGD